MIILPGIQREGKTIIAISHDDHYFDVADRIYKLDSEFEQPLFSVR